MPRRRKALPREPVRATIVDLTHEGKGVARVENKTVFIDQALPGEEVLFTYTQRKRQYDTGTLSEIINPSPLRIEPQCEHFTVCGGCSLQHLDPAQQIHFKQKILIDNLQRIGGVSAPAIRPPVTGPVWGYRRKARLGVKYVDGKHKLLIGFRERASRYLADLASCKVLHPSVGEKLPQLAAMISSLSCYRAVPQIEVAVGDNTTALVLRHLVALSENDKTIIIDFAQKHGYSMYSQPGGLDSIVPLWPVEPELFYNLPAYQLCYDFLPTDFIQVNADINASIVDTVISALAPEPNDTVLELFCGLGNFTLPIARHVRQITAVEGEQGLVQRARDNAARNQIHNAEFHVANLMADVSGLPWIQGRHYERVFLDPPRTGAQEILPVIGKLKPARVVYVSCNPATLARDAGILQRDFNYELVEAGVMDMFPHTAHVESIAIFVQK